VGALGFRRLNHDELAPLQRWQYLENSRQQRHQVSHAIGPRPHDKHCNGIPRKSLLMYQAAIDGQQTIKLMLGDAQQSAVGQP